MTNTSKQLAAALLAVALYSPAAFAETNLSGLYVEGQAGISLPRDGKYEGQGAFSGINFDDVDYSNAFSFGGMAGYRVNPNLRVEGEISYRKPDLDSVTVLGTTGDGAADLGVTTFMANAWYDFSNSSLFTPYIGGGLGVARLGINTDSTSFIDSDDSDVVFAYQLGAGVAYKMTDNVALTMNYRYLDTATGNFSGTTLGVTDDIEGDFSSHEVKAGLRYSF